MARALTAADATFFAAMAQVIPVLLLVAVLERGIGSWTYGIPKGLYRLVVYLIGSALVLSEFYSIAVLASDAPYDMTVSVPTARVVVLVAVALALVVLAPRLGEAALGPRRRRRVPRTPAGRSTREIPVRYSRR